MKIFTKFIGVATFITLLLASTGVIFAQSTTVTSEQQQDAIDRAQLYYNTKQDLEDKQSELDRILINESLLEERLTEVVDEVETLEEQLKLIDDRLFNTETKIKAYQNEIDKNNIEIARLEGEIKDLEAEIEEQKEKFKEVMLVLYFEGESAGLFDENELQAIKLLMNNEEATNVLQRSANLSVIEFTLEKLLSEMKANQEQLERDVKDVEDKNIELNAYKSALDKEQTQLALQRQAKEQVLTATKGEESIYKELIKQAKEEQLRIRRDINELIVDYARYKGQFDKEGFADDDFGFETGSDKLSWPVEPSRGISAFFRDPTYRAALGVEHSAIDIPALQQTPVKAPADGVVLKVKGGDGLDYHYIIIGHNGGLMTLYGHMYDIFVYEGQQVKRGTLIGLSGGMPGSRGAGWLTTGPHLHLEVFLNGVHVDPLGYMDLSAIDKKYLP